MVLKHKTQLSIIHFMHSEVISLPLVFGAFGKDQKLLTSVWICRTDVVLIIPHLHFRDCKYISLAAFWIFTCRWFRNERMPCVTSCCSPENTSFLLVKFNRRQFDISFCTSQMLRRCLFTFLPNHFIFYSPGSFVSNCIRVERRIWIYIKACKSQPWKLIQFIREKNSEAPGDLSVIDWFIFCLYYCYFIKWNRINFQIFIHSYFVPMMDAIQLVGVRIPFRSNALIREL